VLLMPWKLLSSSEAYTYTWLIGYSALLGPIGGILITDYFVIRKMKLDANDLYRSTGQYRYRSGFNPAALIALACGSLPCLPGFLNALGRATGETIAKTGVDTLYESAWFFGFFVASTVYVILMKLIPTPSAPGVSRPLDSSPRP
jgi:nucleobase:cation symporter-1, NCS1 family